MNDFPAGRSWVLKIVTGLLDKIYPPSCGVCRVPISEGRGLCESCDASLPRLIAPFCSVCGEHFEGVIESDFACPNCRDRKLWFDFARPALGFDLRTMGLIRDLKYHKALHLADELGRLATEAFEDERFSEARAGCWPLVPVPMHRSRLRERYFNHAGEIARVVSARTGLSILDALKRVRKTETQTRLTRHQRLQNLHGAFELTRKGKAFAGGKPEGAIVVDDVFTTGSTVDECARALRKAGVQKVIVVTVMRG